MQEDNDTEREGSVVGGFVRLVEHNSSDLLREVGLTLNETRGAKRERNR